MVRWTRLTLIVFLAVMLVFPWAPIVSAQGDNVPAPIVAGNVLTEVDAKKAGTELNSKKPIPGTWLLGKKPEGSDKSKLPILFVQGMHEQASSWWDDTRFHGKNDMYSKAYKAGYQTAFVELYDSAGSGASQWDNGRILAKMLKEINKHFGQKVNVICHSKGTVDTQTALLYHDAYNYVNQVIMLGAPNYGSHLADLCYSWYAGWLASLLGKRDAATYEMQVGRMADYRERTDSHPNVSKNVYLAGSGTDWGPFPLNLGGLYLKPYGASDGIVNVWSTRLPYDRHLFTEGLDHDSIRQGSAVFKNLSAALQGNFASVASDTPVSQPNISTPEQFIYGQKLSSDEVVTKTIPVDAATVDFNLQVLTKEKDTEITLISPDGKKFTKFSSEYNSGVDRGFFAGAIVHSFVIKQPIMGNWTVTISSKKEDAFLLTSSFSGKKTVNLRGVNGKGPLAVELVNPDTFNLATVKIDVKSVVPIQSAKKMQIAPLEQNLPNFQRSSTHRGTYQLDLSSGYRPGFYNLTMEVSGKTKDGQPYQRTIIRSVQVK